MLYPLSYRGGAATRLRTAGRTIVADRPNVRRPPRDVRHEQADADRPAPWQTESVQNDDLAVSLNRLSTRGSGAVSGNIGPLPPPALG